jgi:hypothetical protein
MLREAAEWPFLIMSIIGWLPSLRGAKRRSNPALRDDGLLRFARNDESKADGGAGAHLMNPAGYAGMSGLVG